jgi:hypothetical protein
VASRRPSWARDTDAALLRLRFRDLRLGRPKRAVLRRAIRQLHAELAARGIAIQPHVWFSDEWFSPDGIPGIAIPFYLAHPRLERLERRMSGGVDGGNAAGLMHILRHEAGHAVDTAFRLRRRKAWRGHFGPPLAPYPDAYAVDPVSRDFVQHLDGWYAQAHPAEDFAETFAVWLAPRSRWRSRYAGWPALRKLECMEALMADIRDLAPPVRSNHRIDTVAANESTLADYYRRAVARRAHRDYALVDGCLGRDFGPRPPRATARRAAPMLRAERSALVADAVANVGIDPYAARQLLGVAIERCHERRLWLRGTTRGSRAAAKRMLRRLARAARAGGRMGFTL